MSDISEHVHIVCQQEIFPRIHCSVIGWIQYEVSNGSAMLTHLMLLNAIKCYLSGTWLNYLCQY